MQEKLQENGITESIGNESETFIPSIRFTVHAALQPGEIIMEIGAGAVTNIA